MPTTRSEARPAGRSRHPYAPAAVAAVAALTVSLALGSCSVVGSPERERAETVSGARASRDAAGVPARELVALLERRAVAVRRADAAAYAEGVGGSPAARAEQRRWFAGVTQLPLERVDLDLEPASLVRDGRGWRATVLLTLRLAGYDAAPVVTRERWRFERDGRRLVVAATTDPGWERRHPTSPQPWDLEPVVVREGSGVLGVFDAGSADRADELVAAVEDGVAAMRPRIPVPWDGRVVVYASSSPRFLSSLEGVPGGDPLGVDGVTFPVRAGPEDPEVAATRFVLNPRILDAPAEARDRLVRHELVHVALGARDDAVPVWLGEGLAEYLSVRTLAPADRVLAGEAVAAARAGLTSLPDDDTFNGPGSAAHYGVAWWVCEAIAQTWGEQMLWTLLDELSGVPDPQRRLEQVLGVDEARLLRDAEQLVLTTYGPVGTGGDAAS